MFINEKELNQARDSWGNGIILISKVFDEEGIDKASLVADKLLDSLYGFEFGPILFKPTLSSGAQTFRSDKEGALSYFVGNNPKFPLDNGFGLRSWHKFESQTSQIFFENNIAMWMGWVTLTNKDGEKVKVDKSWGYKKISDGTLKIVLHHSSLPYEV